MGILNGVYFTLKETEDDRFYNLTPTTVFYGFFSKTYNYERDPATLDSLKRYYKLVIPREFITGENKWQLVTR